MKDRPIIFTGESVRAILEGRKTQTRRVIKPAPRLLGTTDGFDHWTIPNNLNGDLICPYGKPGDRLWVKETYAVESNFGIDSEEKYPPPFNDGRPVHRVADADGMVEDFWEQCHYRATDKPPEFSCEHDKCDGGEPCHRPWRSSMFMPRWASRITLEITGVRVERVREISQEDIAAEGLRAYRNDAPTRLKEISTDDFRLLWDSINAKRGFGWDKNPWVWVIEFRKIENGSRE